MRLLKALWNILRLFKVLWNILRLLKALWNIKTCNYVVDNIFFVSIKDHTIKQKMLDSYNQTTTKLMEQNYQTKKWLIITSKKKRPCYETKNDNHVNRLLIF